MDFSTLIQKWYRQNHRKLPWRSSKNPYQIWLSEIILQQTRVDQGLPYYLKFTEKYPDIHALANADEQEVLNLWQGLGYYSRARNLHETAKTISQNYKGKFPKEYSELKKLKGVGDYTAAAISSIAFNKPHAVVDGNVFRVISRYFKIDTPVDSTLGKKQFDQVANELLDEQNAGVHNQAMMELGALICTPVQPKCLACPVNNGCLSFTDQTYANYPVKSGKTKISKRHFNYLVIVVKNKILIKKRQGKDIWQGLYDFRLIEEEMDEENVLKEIQKLKPMDFNLDGSFKHILSHQHIYAKFWFIKIASLKMAENEQLIPIKELQDYPMPQLLIRYLESSKYL